MERPRLCGEHARGLCHIGRSRELAFGIDDDRSLLAFGFRLFCDCAFHIPRQTHVFEFYVVHLESPCVCLFVDNLANLLRNFLTAAKQLVERHLAHDIAHRCLRVLRNRVEKVFDFEDGFFRAVHAVVDDGVHEYRHVVARNRFLVGHVNRFHTHIYFLIPLKNRNHQAPSRLHDAGIAAEREFKPALILINLFNAEEDNERNKTEDSIENVFHMSAVYAYTQHGHHCATNAIYCTEYLITLFLKIHMFGEWLAAAVGTSLIVGSSTPGMLQRVQQRLQNRQPAKERQYKTPDITCVAAAVAARESALATGIKTHGDAVSTAYSTRASALGNAYTASSTSAIRTAVRSSWEAFNTSTRTSKRSWQTTRDKVWSDFKTTVKGCKAPSEILDSGNASSEPKGE